MNESETISRSTCATNSYFGGSGNFIFYGISAPKQ